MDEQILFREIRIDGEITSFSRNDRIYLETSHFRKIGTEVQITY